MTPMPINTEDEELLSRSGVLLKILSLSKFPFHFRFCDTRWSSLLSTQTSSNLIFRQNYKKKHFLSLLCAGAVRGMIFFPFFSLFFLESDILKPTVLRHAQGLFSQSAGEIHHMIITFLSAKCGRWDAVTSHWMSRNTQLGINRVG